MSEDQENYKLHKKSGYVFIFNNNLFWQTAKIRYGSEKDCESITKTFEKLNFIVKTFENLNYKTNVEEKMKIVVKTIDEQTDDFDCVIIFGMSHGDFDDIIQTSAMIKNEKEQFEYDFYTPQDLWKPLTMCKKLDNKPKLIFIQACRGIELEKGHTNTQVATTSKRQQPENSPSNNPQLLNLELHKLVQFVNDLKAKAQVPPQQQPLENSPANGAVIVTNDIRSEILKLFSPVHQPNISVPVGNQFRQLPKEALDVLVMHASTEGMQCVRNVYYGSWFIQTLCKQLNKSIDDTRKSINLEKLLTTVQREVAKLYSTTFKDSKQMPVMDATLCKHFYFIKSNDKLK